MGKTRSDTEVRAERERRRMERRRRVSRADEIRLRDGTKKTRRHRLIELTDAEQQLGRTWSQP